MATWDSSPLKIAQLAPLYEAVPPALYGGTERVVSWLTEALVELGHDVTLFASGDSTTSARLIPCCPRALRLDGVMDHAGPRHTLMLEEVQRRAPALDVIHNHMDVVALPLSRRSPTPMITTLHGRLDLPYLEAFVREFPDAPLVSISDAQRAPLPHACWAGTVHHGLPRDQMRFSEQPAGYLAFVGRISREKRLDRAITIAREVGLTLIVAAKVEESDRSYFTREIEPLLSAPHVTYVGEVNDREKAELLRGAHALLFPIDWPEPFGLVMIEAMACGTPVVAFRCGSVSEIIDEGVTGFICDSMQEAASATRRAIMLDRRRVSRTFEARFTVERMADDYVDLYRQRVRAYAVAS